MLQNGSRCLVLLVVCNAFKNVGRQTRNTAIDLLLLRQYLNRCRHQASALDFTRNFCLADAVAKAVVAVGVAVIVDGAAVDEVGLAVDTNRQVAAVAIHSKLALTARRPDDLIGELDRR